MKLWRSKADAEIPAFNLAAMIDMVLLLVVFFTMSSQFQQSQQKPLDLPRLAGEGRVYEPERSMVVNLEASGQVSIGAGAPVSVQEVAREARAALAAVNNDPVRLDLVVRAESGTRAEHLNTLARALADAGVKRLKIVTAGEESVSSGGFTP
jgi:biopolymer transport protein ExbD